MHLNLTDDYTLFRSKGTDSLQNQWGQTRLKIANCIQLFSVNFSLRRSPPSGKRSALRFSKFSISFLKLSSPSTQALLVAFRIESIIQRVGPSQLIEKFECWS